MMLVIILMGFQTHAATTVTLQPDGTTGNDGDAFVTTGPSNNLVNNNYGAAGAIGASASGAAKGEFKSALRFDVSTATNTFNSTYGANNWAVSAISLQLTVANPAGNAIFNSPNVAGQFLLQWLQSDSWVEGTGTPAAPSASGLNWNQLATVVAAGVESEGSFTYNGDAVGTTVTYTLTPSTGLVNDVLNGTQASLLMSATSANASVLFNSRNNSSATTRPALIITASAIPEPGRMMLLLTGFAGVALRRRRMSL